MQRLKLLSAIVSSTCLFFACTGNSSANSGKDGTSINTSTSNTSDSGGDASFSCMLDGKEFSGSGTDQNTNAAFHLTGDNKRQIYFKLCRLNDATEKLNFQLQAKEGPTTFSVTPTYSYIGYVTKGYINYLDNPLTVTITSINTIRVSGTFSGTYTLSKGRADSNSKQTIEVTDGKFNIPFSTSTDWKKLYNAE